MKKNILVLGGSYFLGRVFMMLAARSDNYNLHVLNRGKYPLKTANTTLYQCDRHDSQKVAELLPELDWDAVIDFCGYEPGDISSLLGVIKGKVGQYIFISSPSVYEPSTPAPKTEESALLGDGGDDGGKGGDRVLDYAHKKVVLEKEGAEACAARGIGLTIFRPGFIYGPFNYAPREPYYFRMILENTPIPVPTDATGRFQFVFVKDLANIIIACINNEKTYGNAYNAAGPEVVDYAMYMDVLEKAHGEPLNVQHVTVDEVLKQNMPLPFPLDHDAEVIKGDKISSLLGMEYTSFEEGMKETYRVYMKASRPSGS